MPTSSDPSGRAPGLVHVTMRRTLATALALIVLLATSIVAASGEISDLETDAFHWVNDLPDAWEPVMYVFQLGGLVGLPAVVAIGAALSRRWRLAATLVALIPLKLLIEKAVIKQLIERERPGASVCAFDRSCGHFRGDVSLDGLSYISGHAVIAWGMAALLWPYLAPRWRWLPVTVAALNSVARVYLGAHVPLDVIGGAATGVALGCLLTMLAGTERRSPASELVDHGDDARGG